jgi:uncharacterized protein YcaQ
MGRGQGRAVAGSGAVAAPRRGDSLGRGEARRVALAAQGLADPRPSTAADARALLAAIRRLGLLQLDSVSVVARAHYLPLFSRLGAYDRALLDRLAAHDGQGTPRGKRRLFEYWAHEASLLPVELQPRLRWRMAQAAAGQGVWQGVARVGREQKDLVSGILRRIGAEGPLAVSDLAGSGRRTSAWWGWHEGKAALEWLFWTGQLTAAGRRGFERRYDLPERVLPAAVLAAPTPTEADAQRDLLRHAVRALGVATYGDLRDYYRLPAAAARLRLAELVEAGEVRPVAVQGWRQTAFLDPAARFPRRARATALLAPFDPLVFERSRTERLFDFVYRIEIYTPADKRLHGYYVLPFLLHDRLVARVDLKADRAARRLLVRGAHAEPWADPGEVAAALAPELGRLAAWLGLATVAVSPEPGLAAALQGLHPAD